LFPGPVATRLDTSTYEKFEIDLWLLPQGEEIRKTYLKIKDLNHRLSSSQRNGFAENDLWMDLKRELSALPDLLTSERRAESSPTVPYGEDEKFMRTAVEEASLSKSEDAKPHPRVGVVVVRGGSVIGRAHRGELALGDHAEYTALERKLADKDLTGATVFTTLEPCTKRGREKTPCAERLVLRRVGRVVIGMLDPNPSIRGKGVYLLKEADIEVAFCSTALGKRIKQLNADFVRDQLSGPPGDDGADLRVRILSSWKANLISYSRVLTDSRRRFENLIIDESPLDVLAVNYSDLVSLMIDLKGRARELGVLLDTYERFAQSKMDDLQAPDRHSTLSAPLPAEEAKQLERSRRAKESARNQAALIELKRKQLLDLVEKLRGLVDKALERGGGNSA
jgi:pyrimidine deaminase RibD-like protein